MEKIHVNSTKIAMIKVNGEDYIALPISPSGKAMIRLRLSAIGCVIAIP